MQWETRYPLLVSISCFRIESLLIIFVLGCVIVTYFLLSFYTTQCKIWVREDNLSFCIKNTCFSVLPFCALVHCTIPTMNQYDAYDINGLAQDCSNLLQSCARPSIHHKFFIRFWRCLVLMWFGTPYYLEGGFTEPNQTVKHKISPTTGSNCERYGVKSQSIIYDHFLTSSESIRRLHIHNVFFHSMKQLSYELR